jgi:hypothetical protein
MSVGTKAEFLKENVMRLLRNSMLGALVLTASAVVLTPESVLADKGKLVPIAGTFAVSLVRPSARITARLKALLEARRPPDHSEPSRRLVGFRGSRKAMKKATIPSSKATCRRSPQAYGDRRAGATGENRQRRRMRIVPSKHGPAGLPAQPLMTVNST